MNRISDAPGLVQALLHGLDADTPAEALVLDSRRLIRILQRSLAELHEHRRQTAGTPDGQATTQLIRYWDAVLGWVQSQHACDVILMNRRGETTC